MEDRSLSHRYRHRCLPVSRADVRQVLLVIDGLPARYEIAQISDNADPTELAEALHMAADTIALLDSLDSFDQLDKD